MEKITAERIAWNAPRHGRPSRYFAFGIVAGLHAAVVMVFLLHTVTRERHESLAEAQAREFVLYFPELSEPPSEDSAPPTAEPSSAPRLRENSARSSAGVSSAITVPRPEPPAPKAPVDWEMELKRSAEIALARAQDKARQEAQFGVHPEVPEALRPHPEAREFAWSYKANRFAGGAVQISEHCSLILGIIPVCRLGKIPIRGDLFADMQRAKSADELDYTRSHGVEPVDRETRLELAALARLLGEWRARRGHYPQDLTDLVADTSEALRNGAQANEGRLLIVDAWQHKVIYKHPSGGSVCDYDLYSLGPNGIDDHGTHDDIVSCGSTPELSY